MKEIDKIAKRIKWAGKNKSVQNAINTRYNPSVIAKASTAGITLIALVVTIILLIILAGVSLNLVLGENGIITKATRAKEQEEIGEITEKLELVKPSIYVDNSGTEIGIDEYLEEVQKEGRVDFSISDIERVNEDNAYIIADGKYEYLLEHEDNGNLKITYQGNIEELVPRIVSVEISNTTNSITAKVEAKRAETYNFYIKDSLDGEYELKNEENETGGYTYTGLTQNVTYYIKIEAINKNGKTETEITRTTGTMIQLTEAELETSMNPDTWTNQNVTTKVTLNTDKNVSIYQLQYLQSEESLSTEQLQQARWSNYTANGIVSTQNETLYFRLYDGVNSTSYMSRKVSIIDKQLPVVTGATPTTNSVEIKATDEASGIVGYKVTETNTEPTSFTEVTSTKSLSVIVESLTQGKTYYAWAKDTAGNVSASKSFKTGMVPDGSATGAITFGAITWDASTHKASVTISTNTNYTIKYQKNSYSGTWTQGTSVTGLSLNDTIYACLSDGTNNGDYTSLKITETAVPSATITLSGTAATTEGSVTATVTHTDNQSGVNIASSKWVYNTTSTEIGTDASKYTGGTFSKNPETITLKSATAGTYYLHVLTTDNAGNVKETISDAVTITLAGNMVTYYVDSSTSYQEKVYKDKTCLSPTTFTPAKSGWTFVGWREDKTASGTVLTSKTMGVDPIVLYAVFKQDITITYYNNTTTAAKSTGTRYYNNGNTVNPTFTIAQASKSGWTARGWSTGTAGNSGITYSSISNRAFSANTTLYGMYQQTITVTYYNNTTTATTTTGTRYYNSNGQVVNPSFTLSQAGRSGWTARGWSTGTAGNSGISYNNATAFTRDSNITLYGMYQQTITVTYYNNTTTAATTTGTRYYNSNGQVVNPSFTLSQAARSGWTARGWSTGTAGNSGISYNNATAFTRDSNITLYGMYQQTITLSYAGNGATSGSVSSQSGTAYYNSAGNTTNATFTIKANGFTKTNGTFNGWALGSASGTKYSAGGTITLASSNTLYATWAHTHTSSCYHTHTNSCYTSPSYGWGLCGWCNTGSNYSSSGSTCPSCGMSPCYPSRVLSCGKDRKSRMWVLSKKYIYSNIIKQ